MKRSALHSNLLALSFWLRIAIVVSCLRLWNDDHLGEFKWQAGAETPKKASPDVLCGHWVSRPG